MTSPIATDSNLVISTSAVSGAVHGTLTGSDADGPATFALASSGGPAHGTVTINPDGTYTYTPTSGYTGTDSFSFTVTEGGETVTATVNVSVANHAPDSVVGTSGNDVLIGGAGANTLDADAGDDLLMGSEGQDTLLGGAGNDILNGGNGHDTLDGGEGIDEAVFAGNLANFTIIQNGDGTLTVDNLNSNQGKDTLISIERLRFSDGVVGPDGQPINGGPTGVTLSGTTTSTAENGGAVKVADIGVVDDGLGTNDVTLSGTDAASFTIVDGASGKELWFTGGANYELKSSYDVIVQARDTTVLGSQPVSQSFTLSITDVNEAPTISGPAAAEVEENAAANTVVATLSGTDPEGNSITYSFVSGNGNGAFKIVGNEIQVADPSKLDFENGSLDGYTLQVKGLDGALDSANTVLVAVTVTDVAENQAPTSVVLSNVVASTPESEEAVKVADIGITDDGLGTNDLTLGGADAGSFEIRDVAGSKELWFLGSADFEAKTSYQVTVIASDDTFAGSQPVSQGLTLGITNVNDNAPSVANAIADQSVAEDTAWSFQVPANTFADADGDTPTYSARLANGDPLPSWLSFDPATRTFSGTPPQNWNGTLAISVIASDGSNSTTDSFVLSVTGVSDAPTGLALDGDTVREIAANGTVVGTLSSPGTAPAGLTYTLLDDAGGRFAISGNQIVVADGLLLDYEQQGTHRVQVQVSDGQGGVFTQSFEVSLTDVAPEIITGDARANTFHAGRGGDRMNGGSGHDHMESGGGKDRLVGSLGRDELVGGAGKDKVLGGKGADDVWGGKGKDLLKGQGGADDFIFTSVKDSGPTQAKWDSIAGFGGKDDIDLSAIDAIKGRKGNQAFDLDLDGSFSAGEIRQTESAGGTLLEMNIDGDAKVEMAIFLKGFHGSLSDGDFVF